MRRLVEVTLGEQVTLLDGIKVHRGRAWVAVLPDPHRPVVHLHAEPAPGEGAALLLTYRRLIEQIVAEAEAATALEPEWREA
jgi:mannose-1-phosphate guanylyltransferase/phosphomannomutase